MQFPGQKPDEKVTMLVRKHWSVLVRQVIMFIIAAGVPLAIYLVITKVMNITLDHSSLGFVLAVLGVSAFELYVLLFFFIFWIDYYLDLWVITDSRIVAIEQEGLFSRRVSELPLSHVQDVKTDVSGFVATMLRYGNVTIETAGEQSKFVFEHIPRPDLIAQKIIELQPNLSPIQQQSVAPAKQNTPTPKSGTPVI